MIVETDARGHSTTHHYDGLGRRERSVDAIGEHRWEHDLVGNQTSQTDRDGRRTQWDYDALNRRIADHEASKRDLQLLQRHLDVDNEDIENALKKFLNPDDPAFNSLEFRGLCLVGFDCALSTEAKEGTPEVSGPVSVPVAAAAPPAARARSTPKGSRERTGALTTKRAFAEGDS